MRPVRIPQDRVGVAIGAEGQTKAMLQRMCGMRIDIDKEGNVMVHDEAKDADPLLALKVCDVIRAIGRGFSPERACRLFKDDEYLEVIDLKQVIGTKTNQLNRIRGRLIGTDGKTRRIIEDLTGVHMTVYGNTVALIGDSVSLPVAKEAVEMIINGSEHATVYHFLESQRPRLRISELGFDL